MPDVPVRLRPRAIVPAGWPPDVLPNQIITAAHINAIRSSVYAWPGDVDGQGHTLSNVHLAGATGVLADPTLAAGDLIARDAAALGRLPIGAAGQVLMVDLAAPAKLKWATPATAPVVSVFGRVGAVVAAAGDYTVAQVTGALADPTTTKGDLIARGAAAPGRLPAGLDGQVLRADAAAAAGLVWSGESVPSVFGRTGAVVAQAGDYAAAQVTNAVSVLGSYPDPAWLPSLSWSKLIGAPATFPAAPHTHDAAAIVSGVLATARLGSGVADATVYLRGDGTWAAAGTGGGGGVVSVFGRAGAVVAAAGDYTAAQVTGAVADPTTIKGDLMVRNDLNAIVRLPAGASGQVLQADTSLTVGMKWTVLDAAVQTPWVTDVNAANFQLINVRRLGVAIGLPAYPLDVVGDINFTGTLRKNGAPVSFGGSQTPWTSDIDAAAFKLLNAGAIGVGTAAPGAVLTVVGPDITPTTGVGTIHATGGDQAHQLRLGYSKTLNYGWIQVTDAVGAQPLSLNGGGGNVGIGTVAAANLLTLAGTSATPSLRFTGGDPAYSWDIGRDNAITGDFVFRQNGTGGAPEKMRIAVATGNVGIGTAAASERLTVSGARLTAYNAGDCTTWADVLVENLTQTANMATGIGFGVSSAYQGHPSIAAGIAAVRTSTAADTDTALAFITRPAGFASQERMRITAAGLVGIGTANPFDTLHVNGALRVGNTTYAGNGFVFSQDATGNLQVQYKDQSSVLFSLMTLVYNGGVGIKKTPAYALDVAGDINYTGALRRNGAPVGAISNRVDYSGTRTLNTVYQNSTAQPMYITVTASIAAGQYLQLLTDANATPVSIAFAATNAAGVAVTLSVGGWIMPGHSYQAKTPSATLVSWIEWP